DGVLYHHVIDPKTGKPADSGLYSVTIISDESYVGDALSTACLVMGLEAGMELIESMDNVYAVFIDDEYNIFYSDGAEDFVR
ncbi:MAG: FAD:protein FMN transferase, partial [Lachnospiraceae bacterium]|nr:FAD:protein FMN transferase [Lachnospiraceae bacterium]